MGNRWRDKNLALICSLAVAVLVLGAFLAWKWQDSAKGISSLQGEVSELNKSIASLNDQIASATSELEGTKNSLQKKTDELEKSNSVLKTHFSTSSAIGKDAKALAATSDSYQSYKGTDYEGNKVYVDEYRSGLSLMESHILKYTKNLNDNQQFFRNLGYEFEEESNSLNQSVGLFQIRLMDMAGYTESLRLKNSLITDVIIFSSTKTYTLNALDYEIALDHIGKDGAQFSVNGWKSKILKGGENDKTPDGIEIGVIYISEIGEPRAGFYVGKK